MKKIILAVIALGVLAVSVAAPIHSAQAGWKCPKPGTASCKK